MSLSTSFLLSAPHSLVVRCFDKNTNRQKIKCLIRPFYVKSNLFCSCQLNLDVAFMFWTVAFMFWMTFLEGFERQYLQNITVFMNHSGFSSKAFIELATCAGVSRILSRKEMSDVRSITVINGTRSPRSSDIVRLP